MATSAETSVGEEVIESKRDTDEIIAKYEEMFASRYTAEDPVYRPYIKKEMDPPPVVENYFVRRQKPNWNESPRDQRYQDRGYKRSHDSSDRQHGSNRQYDNRDYHQGRGWGQHQGQRGDNQRGHHHRQNWQERDEPGDRLQRGYERQRGDVRHQPRHDERQRGDVRHQPRHDEWT